MLTCAQENTAAVHAILNGTRGDLMETIHQHPPKVPRCCNHTANWVQRDIEYITTYPMMLAIRKRATPLENGKLQAPRHGGVWIPYTSKEHVSHSSMLKARIAKLTGGRPREE